MPTTARHGWDSDLPEFERTSATRIVDALRSFLAGASIQQVNAWQHDVPQLQRGAGELVRETPAASRYTAILEYELPLESRRPDVIILAGAAIVVLELKGKSEPSVADIDQASAYARDLRCYHRECADRPVHAVLVPTRAKDTLHQRAPVSIVSPDRISAFVAQLRHTHEGVPVSASAFLSADAYCPLPTLIQAARELFARQSIRWVDRAAACTEPAVQRITEIIQEAARTRTRRLILLTGAPGAGKTLVGLRVVHSHLLDALAVDRGSGRPTAPAVFLSGNGPLVEVLQYELRQAGGGGKAFVRGVKDYVKAHAGPRARVPREHVIVFDEAQRAFDAAMMAHKHGEGAAEASEPDQMIAFADRVPEWAVVLALIGGGQEIHVGEEAGLGQWRTAVERSAKRGEWTIHAPTGVVPTLSSPSIRAPQAEPTLNLDRDIRFHLVPEVHRFVGDLLDLAPAAALRQRAKALEDSGYVLRLTRDLDTAKEYLRERYAEHTSARYGMVASSRDKSLIHHGIPNDYQSTKIVKMGPWYGDDEGAPGGHSCRHLTTCMTEFGAQGLELDAALLACGTDLHLVSGKWSNALATKYKRGTTVHNPLQLRINAYRVLLTRGRDGTIIFVPREPALEATAEYLEACGFVRVEE